MITTIDSKGRIAIPAQLRQALGFSLGQPLEMRIRDGRLEIEVAPTPRSLEKRGKLVVAVPRTPLPTLTAEQVRGIMEQVRR